MSSYVLNIFMMFALGFKRFVQRVTPFIQTTKTCSTIGHYFGFPWPIGPRKQCPRFKMASIDLQQTYQGYCVNSRGRSLWMFP